MEKITSKEKLKEMLESLKNVEIKARDSYIQDVMTFNNFKIKNTVELIKKDEDRHIQLLTELIDML